MLISSSKRLFKKNPLIAVSWLCHDASNSMSYDLLISPRIEKNNFDLFCSIFGLANSKIKLVDEC